MIRPEAPVAELVDAPDSKSGTARCAGSSPARGTTPTRNSAKIVPQRWKRMSALSLDRIRSEPIASAAVAIAVIGLATILGAYFFQYVLGLPPCPLCLEQRYAYYVAIPLAAMVLLGVSVGSSRKVMLLAFARHRRRHAVERRARRLSLRRRMAVVGGAEGLLGAGDRTSARPAACSTQIQNTRVVRCDEARMALPRPVACGLQCPDIAGAGGDCPVGRRRRVQRKVRTIRIAPPRRVFVLLDARKARAIADQRRLQAS